MSSGGETRGQILLPSVVGFVQFFCLGHGSKTVYVHVPSSCLSILSKAGCITRACMQGPRDAGGAIECGRRLETRMLHEG